MALASVWGAPCSMSAVTISPCGRPSLSIAIAFSLCLSMSAPRTYRDRVQRSVVARGLRRVVCPGREHVRSDRARARARPGVVLVRVDLDRREIALREELDRERTLER